MRRKYWLGKLKKQGHLLVHSKHYGSWLKIDEYWNKWRLSGGWEDNPSYYNTAEKAINALIKRTVNWNNKEIK